MVTNRLGVGGIETNLVLLCEEFVRGGDSVHVAAAPGSLSSRLTDLGVDVIPLNGAGSGLRGMARDARIVSELLEEVDVIHVFSAWANVLVRLAKAIGMRRPKHRSTPVLASMMGIVSKKGELPMKSWLRALATGIGADVLVAPSPAMFDLANRLPIRPRRLETQPVAGVRTEVLDSSAGLTLRQEWAIPEDAPLVVTVGRLDSTKSHRLFVDAAAVLVRSGSPAHFLLIGDGDLRAELHSQIRTLGVEHRVHLCGERSDVPAVMAAADVCVRPGVVEGFVGITVLEAQAQGTPVVAFETKDVREAISDGETGLLVPPGDSGALAAAIARLLEDREFANHLGESGRQSVSGRFNIARVAASIRDLYTDLVSAGRPGAGA